MAALMEDDLIKRLRRGADHLESEGDLGLPFLLREAADRLAHSEPRPVAEGLREAAQQAYDGLKWANDRLRECGKQVDFTLGMCMTLSDSERRAEALRAALTSTQGGAEG